MADTDLAEDLRHHLRLTLELHRAVAGSGVDACHSPYSVASALGLLTAGARGDTAAELVQLLGGGDQDLVRRQANSLLEAATLEESGNAEEPVLAVSNTLWAADELPITGGFTSELAGWPGSALAAAPFTRDPESARRMINEDVADITRGLIPELLKAGDVTVDTVASLVNALYLKVAWRHAFGESHTRDGEFHTPDGTRTVPMMTQSERLGYAALDGWQVVSLPAAGGVEATILLPEDDLGVAEAALDEAALGRLLDAPEEAMVRLTMPRFSVSTRASLDGALAALGVREVFTPGADLSGLSDDPRLTVSKVVHESVLRLDEAGLEGAAATAVMMRLVSMPAGDPVDVRVDRPFLLVVRHAATGMVYFFARVVRP